jgi:Zn-dependent peptidase ImmA (M78 family)
VENCSIKNKKFEFSSPIALGLLNAIPFAKSPIEAVLFHAEMLIVESGMAEPPFSPEVYAPLRNVKQVLYKDMKIDGRLIPSNNDFIVELRKDRSAERINFTFAHELAHTFFYESVPSIKCRTLETNYPEYDEEEEKLCDIAASELLMPASVFSKIVKDFSPSPHALKRISQLFKTSLQATLVKLQILGLWNANFVLWKFKNEKPEAQWIARPFYGLSYEPKFILLDFNETSIYHTFLTGDDTADFELFSLNGVYKKSFFKSIQLNSTTVLSCFTNNPNNESTLTNKDRSDLPPLTSKYICRCDGTGWYPIRQNGMKYAARCLALKHQNQRS